MEILLKERKKRAAEVFARSYLPMKKTCLDRHILMYSKSSKLCKCKKIGQKRTNQTSVSS
jgi:hypothetical protein